MIDLPPPPPPHVRPESPKPPQENMHRLRPAILSRKEEDEEDIELEEEDAGKDRWVPIVPLI